MCLHYFLLINQGTCLMCTLLAIPFGIRSDMNVRSKCLCLLNVIPNLKVLFFRTFGQVGIVDEGLCTIVRYIELSK